VLPRNAARPEAGVRGCHRAPRSQRTAATREGFASVDRLSAVKLVATPEGAGATFGGAMRGPELTISSFETRCGAS